MNGSVPTQSVFTGQYSRGNPGQGGVRVVKYKNNDSDLLCDVIRKMDVIQCDLWDYHDG